MTEVNASRNPFTLLDHIPQKQIRTLREPFPGEAASLITSEEKPLEGHLSLLLIDQSVVQTPHCLSVLSEGLCSSIMSSEPPADKDPVDFPRVPSPHSWSSPLLAPYNLGFPTDFFFTRQKKLSRGKTVKLL